MPVINVNLTSPMPSQEKLDKVAKDITEIFVKELGKVPERVVIHFSEIPAGNFYFGAKSVESLRKK